MMALKACPFCGSEAELEHGNDHHGEWFNLGCSRHWGNVDPDQACKAGRLWYTEFEQPEPEAIEAWNRRAPQPAPQLAERGGVAVKALEWWAATGDIIADSIGGRYRLGKVSANANFRLETPSGLIERPSLDYWPEAEAKAAAQADYERRVLSALVPAERRQVTEATTHLGNVLSMLAELHPDDRCEAFESGLTFYNEQRPDAQVKADPAYESRLVITGPLDRAVAALGGAEGAGWRSVDGAAFATGARIRALVETELVMDEYNPALLMGGWKRTSSRDKIVGWLPAAPTSALREEDR